MEEIYRNLLNSNCSNAYFDKLAVSNTKSPHNSGSLRKSMCILKK